MIPDKRALKILFDTFWSPSGWKTSRTTTEHDFEYAQANKLMFDPLDLSHDDIVARLVAEKETVSVEAAAKLFALSLRSRGLRQRSYLSTVIAVRGFPSHAFVDADGTKLCAVCGLSGSPTRRIDLNVLSFEKHKWGGVRLLDPAYLLLDLDFLKLESIAPLAAEDRACLTELLRLLDCAPLGTSATSAALELLGDVKGNKAERETLLDILGISGVLDSPGRPGFLRSFVSWRDRELPPRRFVDRAYPVCWWTGGGTNIAAVAEIFDGLTLPSP